MAKLTPELRRIDRVLVVEDEVPLRRGMALMVRRTWGARVLEAGSTREALALLSQAPDLVIADVCLPDGSALDFLEATLQQSPEPLKIAVSGWASAEQAFALAQLGVRAFLSKPFTLQDLCEAVERVRREAPSVEPLVRASVGRVAMRELQSRVRAVMIDQALALSEGSCTGAARLLRISRQAVQQVDRSRFAEPPASAEDANRGDAGSVSESQPRTG